MHFTHTSPAVVLRETQNRLVGARREVDDSLRCLVADFVEKKGAQGYADVVAWKPRSWLDLHHGLREQGFLSLVDDLSPQWKGFVKFGGLSA